ncbi:MAG: homoserine kinase [Chloroflexi bacterium]|nr:MAG: homoserine kinase [Chloroflexota bacterium]
MPDAVSVRVPATSANLGPGFDCLGLALDLWGTITIRRSSERTEDRPMAAMALIGARRVFERTHTDAYQWQALYEGTLPIARGLGASAVARVGGIVAANELSDDKLDREELLSLATELEGHADNAAPALFGGFQVSAVEDERVFHTSAPLPDGLQAVLFVPEMRVATKDARRVVPDSLSRADAVFNLGRSSLLVAALASGRLDLLDAATQDRLHQRQRAELMPAMVPIFEAARAAGAHCAYLSGSGSTICALATANTEAIGAAMSAAGDANGAPGQTIITRPSAKGAEVVSQ